MNFKHVFLAVVAVASFAGCKGKTVDDIKQNVNDTSFQVKAKGTWAGPCDGKVNPMGFSSKISYNFNDKEFTRRTTYYSDTNCANATSQWDEKGAVEYAGQIDSGQKLNMTSNAFTITTFEDARRLILEATLGGYCGVKSFPLKTEVDVSGGNRNVATCNIPAARTVYNLATIENNVMYLGTGDLQTAETGRPTTLDRGQAYTKQ